MRKLPQLSGAQDLDLKQDVISSRYVGLSEGFNDSVTAQGQAWPLLSECQCGWKVEPHASVYSSRMVTGTDILFDPGSSAAGTHTCGYSSRCEWWCSRRGRESLASPLGPGGATFIVNAHSAPTCRVWDNDLTWDVKTGVLQFLV